MFFFTEISLKKVDKLVMMAKSKNFETFYASYFKKNLQPFNQCICKGLQRFSVYFLKRGKTQAYFQKCKKITIEL